MQVRSLSATAIKDFLQCALKLVFRYDREIPSLKNDHAKIGIAVHAALEQFTRRMLAKKSFPDPSDYEFAITTFMNSATEEGLENMSFYTDGRRIVTEFIDRFDPSEEIIDVEHRFKIVTPEGIPIAGAIDKVVKINEDTIAIIDYKTARNAMTSYELQDDIQLSMYDLAASLIWPQYTNRLLFLDYVRIDKKVSTYRTAEDRQTFRDFLCSIWIQLNKMEEQEIKGRINRLCGWCDYQSYCEAYASFIKSSKMALPALTEMTDDDFISQWEEISDKKAVLESRQRDLKMIAHEKFMQGHEIKGNNKELYSTQQSRTNYDVEQVVNLVPQADLMNVLAVNKGRLDRYAKDDPQLKNKLSRIAQVSYNAPVYKTRALKNAVVEEEVEREELSDENESAA
jgi:putative RecB family exonuclease